MPEMASDPPEIPTTTIPVVKIPNNPAITHMVKPTYSSIVQNLNPLSNAVNAPVSPRTAKKTFNHSPVNFVQQSLTSLPPEIYQNHPAAVFYAEEIDVLAERLKWQLVGKFNKMPSWNKIKDHFQKIHLSGSYSVQWYNYRYIFIKLSNEYDYTKVRRRPVVEFGDNHRMRILKWDTKFSPDKESSIVPVWITFPALPNHFYNKAALNILANSLGTPLQLDEPTANGTRPSHPRVCIEFDCLKTPPEQIFVRLRSRESGLNEDGYWQKVLFERIPKYCTHCHLLGHDLANCKIMMENQNIRGRKTEDYKANSDTRENDGKRPVAANTKEPSQTVNNPPLKKDLPLNQKVRDKSPFLTDNWEIGNRKKAQGGAPLSFEIGKQSTTPKIPVKNSFSALPEENQYEEGESSLNAGIPSAEALEMNNLPEENKPLHPSPVSEKSHLPEKEVQSGKENPGAITPNPAALGPELDLDVRGVARDGSVEAQPPEKSQVIASADSVSQVVPVAEGPPLPTNISMGLDSDRVVLVDKMNPQGPLSAHNSPPKVDVNAQPAVQSASPKSPQAQCSSGFAPKISPQTKPDVSSGDFQPDSGDIDHWLLSERRAERRRSELNKDAVAYFPSSDWYSRSSSWIVDGEDTGPVIPQYVNNVGCQGVDALSERDEGSDFSTYSEFREIDEEYEDDFIVHPPRKWNSTNNLQQMHFGPRQMPPVTRSRGVRVGKGKNKLRFG